MLVLSRKNNESIVINSSDGPITVDVVKIHNNRVVVGVQAPSDVLILRKELQDGTKKKAQPKGTTD